MQPTLQRAWSNLVDYYLKCLEIEQTQTLEVQHQQNHALLRYLTDTLISNGAECAEISHPSDRREVRQFLARKGQQEGQTLYYAYPLVIQDGVKIPICYATVEVAGNSNGDVILARQDCSVVNRRFLRESSDLTESEVADFVRQIGAANHQLAALFPDGAFIPYGMLFRASPDRITANLQWELKWLKNQSTLSPSLVAYLQADPPVARSTDAPSVAVVRSNPAQDKVLRNPFSTLQVVAGPLGTGKTQTIINLIANTVCWSQTVLFVSKNNTAVDNVYDAFLEQKLFPGILRLGNQEARKRAVERVRAVMDQLQEGMPQPEAQTAFDAQGIALNREIARLEEELHEVSTLSATVQEMALLLRRVDGDLQERGLYRYATDLAQQITLENAAQFQPPQLVGLRRLVARTAPWSEPPKGFWERLLARLSITRWQQRVTFERALQALALPGCCTVAGEDLQQRLDNLLRLDAIYPFLLATARHLKAMSDLAAKRSPELIRGELEQVHQAKIEHGRRQLRRRWAEIVNAAQRQLAELAELCALFARITAGAVEIKERQTWREGYGKLLRIFPVICSTNLSLAGTAPNERNLFDLVILDEASQSDIASFLPALYRAQRACVVGDDKQLRHISNLGIEEDERQMALAKVSPTDTPSYHRHSAFDRAMAVSGRTAFTLLDRHYRCVPEIIAFCNAHFYEGKLKIERSDECVVPLPGGLPARGFLFEDIAAGRTDYRVIAASRSASNRLEAERVIGLVQTYIAAGLTDIGVVTPLRGQRELLTARLAQARQAEGQPAIRVALAHVEIGTIHTFQGGQHQVMLLSTVVAPGAKEGTVHWFEENKNLLNVAISRAQDLLIVVGHQARLEQAGGILAAMMDYAARRAASRGAFPPLPPGLQPERLGLLAGEQEMLKHWLNPPGAVAEVLNGGEQELYRELLTRVGEKQIMVTPKMWVLDTLEPTRMAELTQPERDYAFRAHFDLVLVETQGFKPVVAVELDGATHAQDPLTMARDRLKNSICEKVGLPLLRVRWRDWGALERLGCAFDTGYAGGSASLASRVEPAQLVGAHGECSSISMGLWQQCWDGEHCNMTLSQALRKRLTTREAKGVDGGTPVHGGGDRESAPRGATKKRPSSPRPWFACDPPHPAYSRPIQGSLGGAAAGRGAGTKRGAVALRHDGLVVSSRGWSPSHGAQAAAGLPRSPRMPHEGRVVLISHSSPC